MKCYSCNRTICEKEQVSEGECKAHDEHIIPAAIGGHLTSRTILCKDCGNEQGKKSDSGFTGLFRSFVELLRSTNNLRSFDHKSKDSIKVDGILEQNGELPKKIKYQDGKVMPLRPFYEIDCGRKTIHLYGDKNGIKNARKKAEMDLRKEGKDMADYKEEIHKDMSGTGLWSLFFSEGVHDFNERFKSGMLKIAVEYALHNGISPELINIALIRNEYGGFDFNDKKGLVIPFFPLTKVDRWYEEKIDNLDKNYPFHAMRLFSCGTELYCYVELFSTFKYFVVLSDKYSGDPVDVAYAEPLLKEDIPYTYQELDRFDYKDLVLFFQDENIDRGAWNRVVEAENRSEVLMELLEKRPKKFDYLQSITRIYNRYYQVEILSFCKDSESPSMSMETIMDNYIGSNSVEKGYSRKFYLTKEGEFIPYPIKCDECYAENPDKVKEYTFAAFNKFSEYVNNKISGKP